MNTRRAAVLETLHMLKTEVGRAKEEPKAFAFLPGIEAQLDWMIQRIFKSRAERSKSAGALARVVTEDYAFSESDLGGRLLEVADEYAEME